MEPIAMRVPETPKCPANEFFNPCGSACAPTCKNPNPSPVCTKECVPACFCREGLLRHDNGECVQQHQCNNDNVSTPVEISAPIPKCPTENEVYHECGVQLNCLSSCTFKHTPECMQRMCTPGCMCKKPFVRHDNGRCVEVKECPNKPPFVPQN
jgi:hypothetical protein